MKPQLVYEANPNVYPNPIAPPPIFQPFTPKSVKQHCKFAELALAAPIEQQGSVLLSANELANRAWDVADETVNVYQTRMY